MCVGAAAKRVALVIGNAKYRYGSALANPHKDAETIAGVLERLGFALTRSSATPEQGWHTDLDLISMKRLIADFSIAAEQADMVVVYFAGHGMEIDGQNYLLPIDAELEHVRRVRAETASLQEIVDDVADAKTLPLIILDACRDNPFLSRMRGLDQGRSFRSGLADVKSAGNLYVAYAARQGAKALDGPLGGNSPFAKALAEHLETPDVDIRILMGHVRDAVRDATKHVQFPHVYGSLGGGTICLKRSADSMPPQAEAGVMTVPVATHSLEWSKAEWERIRDTGDIAWMRRFADHAHPYYAAEARERARVLEAEAEASQRQAQEHARRKAESERLARQQEQDDRRAGIVRVAVGPGGGRDEIRPIKAGSGVSFRDIGIGPEMLIVPAGEFLMGSPDDEPERGATESPRHKVIIPRPFAVGRHAITRGEFAAFVNASGHKTEGGAYVWDGGNVKLDPAKSWRDPGFAQDDSHPVVCVNWDDAQAYAKWLKESTEKDCRLLSEAEWEYAARAGRETPFWWGSSITPDQANYDGNYSYAGGKKGEWRQKTVPVKSFEANPWGLYQVHGNAWEWCEDCWNGNYNGAPEDGSVWTAGDCGRRVLRGGSWNYDPWFLRAAFRVGDATGSRFDFTGFRLARTLNP